MDLKRSCAAAVLIGGRSSRMGAIGLKQHLLLADGRTMLAHLIATLRCVCDPPVILLGGSASDHAGLNLNEWKHLHDLRRGLGPLAGIEALLASRISSQYLICPCDTPHLTEGMLRRLLEPSTALTSVFRIKGKSQIESLPLRISAAALPIIRRHLDSNQRSVWRAVLDCQPHIVELDARDAALLTNINTPEDLEK